MKLDFIEILTADLEATKHFYQRILEFSIVENDPNSVSFKIGWTTLKFVKNLGKKEPMYHLAFNIPENKLEEAILWSHDRLELIQKGDEVLITEFKTWNAHAVYFYDNNGNLLEFIARHDLENAQNEIFDSKQILNVSEIGIVKNNPAEFGQRLIENYGLPLFRKSDNTKLFTAMGDDDGLLIIVKDGRHWYPTEIPAKSNRTKIKLSNEGLGTTIQTE